MPFELRPAVRENVPLLIGLAGGTGSGKTYSALQLAEGLAGDAPIAVIDTESGRAKAYADRFRFDTGELIAPFRPEAYERAIVSVDKMNKYGVIVVDSVSHEWAGEGGILDWQEEELEGMARGDFQRREACKMASWIKPKMAHKSFINKLLQVRSHLILCFRAEVKTEMTKVEGKWIVQPKTGFLGVDGWFPICEKSLPFELTLYFLLHSDDPGVPHPIKLMAQHRPFFDLSRQIAPESGVKLADWARGGKPREPVAQKVDRYVQSGAVRALKDDELEKLGIQVLNEDQVKDLEIEITEAASVEQLQELGIRCRQAPQADRARLRELYAFVLYKLREKQVQNEVQQAENSMREPGDEPPE